MKRKESSLICILLFVVWLLGVHKLYASDNQIYNGKLSISPSKIEVKGDSIFLDFNIGVNSLVSSPTKAVKIIPYITNGNDRYDFPPIIINGKSRAKYFRREQALSKPAYNKCYKAITQTGENQIIQYKVHIPYLKWMVNSPLYIATQQTGNSRGKQISSDKWMTCCVDSSSVIPDGNEKLMKLVKKATEEHHYTLVISDKQDLSAFKTKSTTLLDAKSEANLVFRQGKVDISSTLSGNGDKLKKLHEIVSDGRFSIKKIHITVACSPEGSYNTNTLLVRERAKALRKYLCENYSLCSDSLYEEHLNVEDWDGLVSLIKDYPVPYKEEVLYIIKSVSIFKGREKKIMDLRMGVPYKYMYHHIFPLLRRAEFQIDYIKKVVE